MTDLPTLLAELEEAERALSRALGLINTKASIVSVAPRPLEEDLNGLMLGVRSALSEFETIRTHLPTLIEAVKRQGEAKDRPIWGVWVDYNLAPPGSYACLVSSFVNGEWSDPEARWMPAQGRPRLQGQMKVMPHLMPNDPRAALKETTDV